MKFVNKNYCEILDIEPDASEEEIKRAYQLVRGTWNPDSIAVYSLYTPEENDAIGHKIEEAFHILSNAERRASYDRFLKEVDRLPTNIETPAEFWDFAHGIAPPTDEDLEDVTDLLAEADAVVEDVEEVEGVEERVLLEAVGGESRGFSQMVATPEERGSIPAGPSRTTTAQPAVRGEGNPSVTAAESLTPASAHSVSEPNSRIDGVVSDQGARRPGEQGPARNDGVVHAEMVHPRTPRAGSVPPAPPAPPDSAPTSTRSALAPGHSRNPRKQGRDDDSRRRAVRSGPESRAGQRPTPTGDSGTTRPWTRSFARPLRVPPPLPDRPVPGDMMARLIEEHGYSGPFLRAIREFKEIRLEDISDRTKIQKTYLRCIEEEQFDALPARVYVEGFVAQYAKLLRLDARQVAERYMERYDRKTAPPSPLHDAGSDDI